MPIFYFRKLRQKYISATNGEGDIRAEGILFLVNLLKFESDIKEDSNNKVIINLGKLNFTLVQLH